MVVGVVGAFIPAGAGAGGVDKDAAWTRGDGIPVGRSGFPLLLRCEWPLRGVCFYCRERR